MFTVKFILQNADYSSQVSISCPRYSVHQNTNADRDIFMVTVYTKIDTNEGVEYRVCEPDKDPEAPLCFDTCFVENESGKTIDTITPRVSVPPNI